MEFTAKTVEEAIALGLAELDITEELAEIKVIEEPTKGLFGKLKGKAVVEITKKASGNERALIFVNTILDMMDFTAKAELDESEENPTINIFAEKSSELIGYRGEVLDAIQTLASAVSNIGNTVYQKVVVDCENYRGKREDTLIKLAHKLEEKATDMKREVILEPMNPFERRIIHTALADSKTVTTRSDGKEPNRYVVIVPNDKDEFSTPYNAGRNNDKKGNGGKKFDRRKGGRNDKGGRRFDRKKENTGFGEIKKKPSLSFGTYLGNSKKDNM